MNTIFIWLATIITFLLGYALGKGSAHRQRPIKLLRKSWHTRVLPQYTQPSGLVKRPDAKTLFKRQHPEIQQEEEEMAKTLDGGIQPLTR
jgi:hypothetical protein